MKRILILTLLLIGTILATSSDIDEQEFESRTIRRRKGKRTVKTFHVRGVDDNTVSTEFAKFASSHNKNYGSTNSYEERRNAFAKNMEEVNKLNEQAEKEDPKSAAKFELNGFADVEEIELKNLDGY